MAETKIEWTATRMPDGSLRPGYTMNFWIGCQEVSPACDFCYARVQNERRKWVKGWGPHGERRRTGYWKDAYRWNRTARDLGVRLKVFSNSLSDFFDKAVDDTGVRDEAWDVINECRNLDWLLLTKRPQNITNRLPAGWMGKQPGGRLAPWPHVWLGTTVENQEEADRRIPHLLAVPAKVHFLSCEPLLGAIDLTHIELGERHQINALTGGQQRQSRKGTIDQTLADDALPSIDPRFSFGVGIDWVIGGGESGSQARVTHPNWARSLRDQCAAAGVPFFWKQWGEYRPFESPLCLSYDRMGKARAGALLDGREHKEWPAVIRTSA